MRLSELLGSECFDRSGRRIGLVHDVRLRRVGARFRVSGLVIGGDGIRERIAHSWGYAQGRARGPAALAALARPAVDAALVAPAELVGDWGPGTVRILAAGDELPRLREVIDAE